MPKINMRQNCLCIIPYTVDVHHNFPNSLVVLLMLENQSTNNSSLDKFVFNDMNARITTSVIRIKVRFRDKNVSLTRIYTNVKILRSFLLPCAGRAAMKIYTHLFLFEKTIFVFQKNPVSSARLH